MGDSVKPGSLSQSLARLYPGALPEQDYLSCTAQALADLGFERDNTLACVGVCRDEMTRSFVDGVQRSWGNAFDFSSLAGLLFLGKTGMRAALAHAPDAHPVRRYIFHCMPHIGVDAEGSVGLCIRPGQSQGSGACGALIAFRSELLDGKVHLELDPEDLEQSLLRRRLYPRLVDRPVPSLEELTHLAHHAVVEDLERLLTVTLNFETAAFAVLTGIQIHTPGANLVWPGTAYAVVQGKRHSLASAP